MEHSIVKDMEFMYLESNDPDINDAIEPIVKRLEAKGYKVKYASPGYDNTRFSNDRDKDGVVNGKMVGTAKIIFEKNYKFKTTPDGWEWKILPSNGFKALYVAPYSFNKKKYKSEEEARKQWREFYLSNIKTWVTQLPEQGSDEEAAPDTEFDAT